MQAGHQQAQQIVVCFAQTVSDFDVFSRQKKNHRLLQLDACFSVVGLLPSRSHFVESGSAASVRLCQSCWRAPRTRRCTDTRKARGFGFVAYQHCSAQKRFLPYQRRTRGTWTDLLCACYEPCSADWLGLLCRQHAKQAVQRFTASVNLSHDVQPPSAKSEQNFRTRVRQGVG